MKQKIFFTILVMLTTVTKINAQQSLNAAGGNASGSGGNVSYSLGQVAYITATGSGGKASQGVQQAFEIFTLKGEEFTQILVQATAYPNPTISNITLSIKDYSLDKLYVQLNDIQGKTILNEKIIADETFVNMQNLSANVYFLSVTNGVKTIKTFKIVKN